MQTSLIETLGDELYHAMSTQTVVEPLTSRHPEITIENAYHIQQRMLIHMSMHILTCTS
jgi:2-oxopent-4-enoate/cis-2-oxohex-4-enoate hydratase